MVVELEQSRFAVIVEHENSLDHSLKKDFITIVLLPVTMLPLTVFNSDTNASSHIETTIMKKTLY